MKKREVLLFHYILNILSYFKYLSLNFLYREVINY